MDFARQPREPRVTPGTNLSLNSVAANLADPERPEPMPVSRAMVWLHRGFLVIFVMFCIELGMLLAALPWTRVWSDNSLLALHPGLRAVLQNNFVRGVITGFGLIDIWIGIWEAVHYRDPGKKNNL